MAVFNDHLRNAIRGDLDGTATGFATGPGGDREAVKRGVLGAIDDFTQEPGESVNYASAHDNLTLADKVSKAQPGASDGVRRAMQKLALGMVLTSQGVPFLHGASDFAATKGGNHNSYNAGDAVNRFDWSRKAEFADMHAWVRGVIGMRRTHPAFRMADDADVRRAVRFIDGAGPLAFTIDGSVVGDPWRTILVAYNGEPQAQALSLPGGDWEVVVDADRAGTATLRTERNGTTLPPYSMFVAHRR
jgi:pullulanase